MSIATEIELHDILQRLTRLPAPKNTVYVAPHSQYIVGIGDDDHASITIDNDALETLEKVPAVTMFSRVIKQWGHQAQMVQAMEECGELVTVLSHYLRGRADDSALADEIADVEIMCRQLREIIGSDIVEQHKNAKLIRLQRMLGIRNQEGSEC